MRLSVFSLAPGLFFVAACYGGPSLDGLFNNEGAMKQLSRSTPWNGAGKLARQPPKVNWRR